MHGLFGRRLHNSVASVYMRRTFQILNIQIKLALFFTLQEIQHSSTFILKPSSEVEKLDTSEWPLLLKVNSIALLFYVHGKHLRSCRDGQLT